MDYNQELLFTPEGVRDIYAEEYAKKLHVQHTLEHLMNLYGFKSIQTPTYEFFDIFNGERGTASSREMFKFFDRHNNTLVLRPDVTPSIARCMAKYYKDEEMPVRLSYVANTFANHSSYKGKLSEVTQIGAELMNDGSSDGDAEMVALMIESLQKSGLSDFQVDIGHAQFFDGLVEEAGLTTEETKQLKELIENKNIFGVSNLVEHKSMPDKLKQFITKLPEMFGDMDVITEAKKNVTNEKCLAALSRMSHVLSLIERYGLEKYVTIDLCMLNHYGYYTGIIFKAYTYGTGEAVASGGRYDNLIAQFGKQSEAIGIVILLDQLMIAKERQKIDTPFTAMNNLIVYHAKSSKEAIALANDFRERDEAVQLVRKDDSKSENDYRDYAKRYNIKNVMFINESEGESK